ncbi:MAG: zf-HC2 domain-containing protein [Gemmatimonadales bacterium]|nr:zf-HC2 domain-containing protein [Gemmatimonadales bacterium]MBP6572499.1 zf-HC2 domain-containing protein [Gemmatimonadales bacterium]MBP7619516.1 zf-HC2 domain-containing protein [Gemmatimonadales bacterium]
MTSHLDDGTIHELLDGEIPSAQLPPLQAHLASCADCRARLESARELVDFSDELVELLDDPPVAAPVATVVTPLPSRSSPWIRQLAWAASIAVAVGAGWYARGDVQQVLPAVRVDSPIADAISAVPPTTVTAPPAAPARATTPPAVMRDRREPAAKLVQELADNRSDAAAKTVSAEPRSAVEPAAAPAPVAALRGARTEQTATGGGLALGNAETRRLAPRDQVMTKQLIDIARVDTISFVSAMEAMGGKLRLIDGLVPLRFEQGGGAVRVVYRLGEVEVQLVQSLVAEEVRLSVNGPPGFPTDSLAALRRRVRE